MTADLLMEPPENEIPGGVAINTVLLRTDSAALTLTTVEVYSQGLSFTLDWRTAPWHHGPSLMGALNLGLHESGSVPGRDGFVLRAECSDGRSVVLTPWADMSRGDVPIHAEQALVMSTGEGNGGTFSVTFWLTPLPPSGPVTIVTAWPALGLAETKTVLDAAKLASALGRVEVLWPWEPAPELQF